VGCDDACERTSVRSGRQFVRGITGEGISKKGQAPGGIGRITIRMMPGVKSSHERPEIKKYLQITSSFSSA